MTFDFRKIESDYPKAFALLKEWIAKENHCAIHEMDGVDILDGEFMIDNGGYECLPIIFNPLELCFFFDEQGGITGTLIFRGSLDGIQDWSWMLGDEVEESANSYPSRSEVLAALWLKEFEILEQRLESEKTV